MTFPIRIPGWAKFQAYKRRTPPWIRLYREILNKSEWAALSGDAAKLLVELWLIASESDNKEGVILTPTKDLAWRLRRPLEVVVPMLLELRQQGFIEARIQDADTMLAPCRQDAGPETEAVQRQSQRQSKSTAAEVSQIEFTITGVALEAHRVLGMGTWGDELSRKYSETKTIIRKTWVASGIPLDEVHAAIHGLRIMVDRGDVDWLADRKQKPLKGLEVLVNAQAIIPGPDGGQLRSLFSAAADAYRSEQAKPSRTASTGPQRLRVDEIPRGAA